MVRKIKRRAKHNLKVRHPVFRSRIIAVMPKDESGMWAVLYTKPQWKTEARR
jgi:hypothetical protein